jgi:oligo-1,6-glucosidase/alpha-glucosidase
MMRNRKWYLALVLLATLLLPQSIIANDSQSAAGGSRPAEHSPPGEDRPLTSRESSMADLVIYQIYPRSFRDSTGDGVGDLRGIIEKLDYLQELGINAIWFSPFFKSPQGDFGYDVSDYYDISSEYGTMADFDELLKEMHARDMKMILDLPLNHTSIEHPWFQESASSKDNPKRDWYIWRDGKKPGGETPPNNWKAIPGGSAWRYFENTDQWVYFHFLPFQPDLNYRNPEVKEAMFNVLRFWLDKGVDGFRLDILHAIYEDKQLRDDSFSWAILPSDKTTASLFTAHKYDLNLPETYDFAMELRKVVDEYQPERFLLGEVFGSIEELRKYYGPENNGLQTVFLFEFTSTPFKPDKYAEIIGRIEKALPPPYTPMYVLSNHDRVRFISRLKNSLDKAKIAAAMQLTLRGVPIVYYGEDIGMPNSEFELSTSKDPIGRKYAWVPDFLCRWLGLSLTRDGCRTPMQWSDKPTSGFSVNPSATTWLKISDSYKEINVAKEREDPGSLLNCYKRLLKIRKENATLRSGSFDLIELDGLKSKCLAYRRMYEEQSVFIYLNFSKDTLKLRCPIERPALLFSTLADRVALDIDSSDGTFSLGPFEGIAFEKQ